jgi:hypothetical protein
MGMKDVGNEMMQHKHVICWGLTSLHQRSTSDETREEFAFEY